MAVAVKVCILWSGQARWRVIPQTSVDTVPNYLKHFDRLPGLAASYQDCATAFKSAVFISAKQLVHDFEHAAGAIVGQAVVDRLALAARRHQTFQTQA
ncbi:hypothetical protein RUM8411_04151 [Ruegeria meonggei]|uniref:Uncharacterized protein n=1 Tax=Ruegeria meonggei TaxID=1446476 RepID=A0A1X7AC98_9RHOB|nr:hypothetical protein RUM8411_04151 [Ruegeria meonggei]